MSFTNSYMTQELIVATDEHSGARWSGGKPGEFFRCGFCGHKFKDGDKFRWCYTNDIKGAGGNPLVCEACNDSNEELRARWAKKCHDWNAFVNARENWHLRRTFQ